MEDLEIYDPLQDKETLVIYMASEGQGYLHLSGGMLTSGRYTNILRESYDYRPLGKRKVKIGDRLYCGMEVPGSLKRHRSLPTDWVVTKVENYEPTVDVPGFREVVLAYCDRQPLTLDEFKNAIRESNVTVSIDSFGGDEDAYRQFQESNAAKGYVCE
jgi:hypothetical protein